MRDSLKAGTSQQRGGKGNRLGLKEGPLAQGEKTEENLGTERPKPPSIGGTRLLERGSG